MSSLLSAAAQLVVVQGQRKGPSRTAILDRDEYRSFVSERRPIQPERAHVLTEWAKRSVAPQPKR